MGARPPEVSAFAGTTFGKTLDHFVPEGTLGLAVSGGPDSLALLLLAAAARPGRVQAATVDHGLRPEAGDEALLVAEHCGRLGVPHQILPVEVQNGASLQAQAREARYAALAGWAQREGLAAVATAHHADDQAETLLMRLNRGSGLAGLSGVRSVTTLAGLLVIRPLLHWRRAELAAVCAELGVVPVDDPSNADERFDRVRVRAGLQSADWIDVEGMARSAAHLAGAEAALNWAVEREWERSVEVTGNVFHYRPDGPIEIRRRIVTRILRSRNPADLRGSDVAQLIGNLSTGGKATLADMVCTGGERWRFEPAPPRRGETPPKRM